MAAKTQELLDSRRLAQGSASIIAGLGEKSTEFMKASRIAGFKRSKTPPLDALPCTSVVGGEL